MNALKDVYAIAGGIEGSVIQQHEYYRQKMIEQLGYLARFGWELEQGIQDYDGRVPFRTKLYIYSARGFYENLRRITAKSKGMTKERRIQSRREDSSYCLIQAEKGWSAISTLPDIGSGPISKLCTCTFEFK